MRHLWGNERLTHRENVVFKIRIGDGGGLEFFSTPPPQKKNHLRRGTDYRYGKAQGGAAPGKFGYLSEQLNAKKVKEIKSTVSLKITLYHPWSSRNQKHCCDGVNHSG